MVIDSSALIAVLFNEPERRAFNEKIEADPVRMISAVTLVEASMVVESRRGEIGGRELDLFVHRAGIEVVAFTAEQAVIARDAFRRFGRGRHPARLNFGDCCAYALAAYAGEPLLFKRTDFPATDIRAC